MIEGQLRDSVMSGTVANVKSIFGHAIQIPSSQERTAYLKEACGNNPKLQAEVEALLKAHLDAQGFLKEQKPALSATVDEQPRAKGRTAVIGPYKLMEQIGEGGMGLVFVAEQQKPVKR